MGLEASISFLIVLIILGGLLLTSICFAIEIYLRRHTKKFEKYFPYMGVGKLAKIEAEGKGSLYLYQVTGQAIMHFNIFMGIGIILLLYVIYTIIFNGFFEISLFRTIVGIALLTANFYVAKEFYKWGKGAVESVNNKNLYVFDLHGTLIQGNEDAMYEILKKVFDEKNLKININKQKLEELMGSPLDEIFGFLSPNSSREEISHMVDRFRKLSPEISPKYLKPIEGILELLMKIKESGNVVAVVTTAHEKLASKMIEWTGISKYVDELRGLGEGDPIRFKTTCISDLKSKYDYEKVYMIGDKEEDMIAGYHAQAITVLFNPKEKRKDEYTDFIISNYDDFAKII